MRKLIKSRLFWFGIAVVAVAYLLFTYLWYGTVELRYSGDVRSVQINGAILSDDKLKSDNIRLRPGTHNFFAYGPRIDNTFMKVSLSPFGKKLVNIEPKQLSERETIDKVAKRGLPEDMEVGRGALLEGDTWMVVLIFSPEGRREGYTNIYNYTGTSWRLYDSGTGFDLEGYTQPGYPKSVVEYMEGEMW